jgi:hypothetical protein
MIVISLALIQTRNLSMQDKGVTASANLLEKRYLLALPCGAREQISIIPLFVEVSATEISFDVSRK